MQRPQLQNTAEEERDAYEMPDAVNESGQPIFQVKKMVQLII